MDYIGVIRGLFKEAKKNEQFKDMSSFARITIKIALFPLSLLILIAKAYYYVTFFVYRGFFLPLEHLHTIVKKEGQEVKHATQFIIYWIAFPLIFLLYVFQALFAVSFYFQWFILMTLVYLKSLSGVRWQPFLTEVRYDEEHVYEYKHSSTAVGAFITLLLVSYAAIIICIIAEEGLFMVWSFMALFAVMCLVNPLLFKKSEITDSEEYVI